MKPLLAGLFVALLLACSKPTEQVVAVYESGATKVSQMVDAKGEIVERREWHANGILAKRFAMSKGKAHGSYKRWGSNGVLYAEGQYEAGKAEGQWTYWYARAQKESEGKFQLGLQEGDWTGWHPDGGMAWKRYFKQGKAQGLWLSYYASGALFEENSCHALEKEGFLRRLSPDGRSSLYEACQSGLPHGLYLDYYEGGALRTVGTHFMGQREGKWRTYRAGGGLWKEEGWKDGLREGKWFWLSPSLDTVAQGYFQAGTGTFSIPCPKPRKLLVCAESTWVKGLLEGTSLSRPEESPYIRLEEWEKGEKKLTRDFRLDSSGQPGRLATEGYWKQGKREGIWRNWYSDGTLKDSLHYHQGQYFGSQFHYAPDGHLYMKKLTRGKGYPVIIEKLGN